MIQLHKSADGKFYFVVMATNGKTLSTSETYTRKENALKGIHAAARSSAAAAGLDPKKIKRVAFDDLTIVAQ